MGSEWVRVDSARRLMDASLLKLALEAAEIEVRLRGEHLQSIAGEIPLNEAEIELWVPAQEAERARQVLHELRTMKIEGPPQICPKCDEENPPNFELCWNCQWSLPK